MGDALAELLADITDAARTIGTLLQRQRAVAATLVIDRERTTLTRSQRPKLGAEDSPHATRPPAPGVDLDALGQCHRDQDTSEAGLGSGSGELVTSVNRFRYPLFGASSKNGNGAHDEVPGRSALDQPV
jgi:hypothetical protein